MDFLGKFSTIKFAVGIYFGYLAKLFNSPLNTTVQLVRDFFYNAIQFLNGLGVFD